MPPTKMGNARPTVACLFNIFSQLRFLPAPRFSILTECPKICTQISEDAPANLAAMRRRLKQGLFEMDGFINTKHCTAQHACWSSATYLREKELVRWGSVN